MARLNRLPALLLALNWLALVAAFAWTCKVQGHVLWWLRLDWSGWFGDFAAMSTLDMMQAGSVWLAWLAATGVWSLVAMLGTRTRVPSSARAATPTVDAARRQLGGVSDMMQSRPELKAKILKLHQSLDKL